MTDQELDELEIGDKFIHTDGHQYIKFAHGQYALDWETYVAVNEKAMRSVFDEN